ncbi:MAG: hypothetical protein PHT79_01150 [Syntrophomonadaceae bacterium]|nr:hypothetical protein [Syntrophomonadaceae bacterium]MDD3889589.1 hypothetical protein [Syntrophomonadaceae bacterium]MDD4548357.1 hypothetical protein [Syntrophomonadaceae bacterium]
MVIDIADFSFTHDKAPKESPQWINAYLPDRSYKGGSALEDLIKHLVSDFVVKLNDIETKTNFDYLFNMSDPEIREEALVLFQEIEGLKKILQEL